MHGQADVYMDIKEAHFNLLLRTLAPDIQGNLNTEEIKLNLRQALIIPEKEKQERSQICKKFRSTIIGKTKTWYCSP